MIEPVDPPLLEVCCASPDFALQAEDAGADRVELCANLVEGGTTPSHGAIEATVRRLTVPTMVMIRPRGGDFLYSRSDIDVMLRDIEIVASVGAAGVVFGALRADGSIDRACTAELIQAARPMEVTFHRAFDMSRDLVESLDVLVDLGVDRILTSAGRSSVLDDLDTLGQLVARAAGTLSVMPGGGIRPENVDAVLGVRGVREIHVGASRWRSSEMTHRVRGVEMGRSYEPDEYVVESADIERVSKVAGVMRSAPIEGSP